MIVYINGGEEGSTLYKKKMATCLHVSYLYLKKKEKLINYLSKKSNLVPICSVFNYHYLNNHIILISLEMVIGGYKLLFKNDYIKFNSRGIETFLITIGTLAKVVM